MAKLLVLGTYYRYLICDVTHYPQLVSPVQDSSAPLYLGIGDAVPPIGGTFGKDVGGPGRLVEFRVTSVLPSDDGLNPFDCPVVMVVRESSRGS